MDRLKFGLAMAMAEELGMLHRLFRPTGSLG